MENILRDTTLMMICKSDVVSQKSVIILEARQSRLGDRYNFSDTGQKYDHTVYSDKAGMKKFPY